MYHVVLTSESFSYHHIHDHTKFSLFDLVALIKRTLQRNTIVLLKQSTNACAFYIKGARDTTRPYDE